MQVEKYKFLYDFYGQRYRCKEIFEPQAEGFTSLHIASAGHDLKKITELIEKGDDINVQGKDGSTPLHLAVVGSIQGTRGGYLGHKSILEFLEFFIKKGADVNIKNKAGKTPLFYIVEEDAEYCKKRSVDIAKILIKNGKKANHKFLSLLRKVSERERAGRIKRGNRNFKDRKVQTKCDKIIELVEKNVE